MYTTQTPISESMFSFTSHPNRVQGLYPSGSPESHYASVLHTCTCLLQTEPPNRFYGFLGPGCAFARLGLHVAVAWPSQTHLDGALVSACGIVLGPIGRTRGSGSLAEHHWLHRIAFPSLATRETPGVAVFQRLVGTDHDGSTKIDGSLSLSHPHSPVETYTLPSLAHSFPTQNGISRTCHPESSSPPSLHPTRRSLDMWPAKAALTVLLALAGPTLCVSTENQNNVREPLQAAVPIEGAASGLVARESTPWRATNPNGHVPA